jgi:hypothetical protein
MRTVAVYQDGGLGFASFATTFWHQAEELLPLGVFDPTTPVLPKHPDLI